MYSQFISCFTSKKKSRKVLSWRESFRVQVSQEVICLSEKAFTFHFEGDRIITLKLKSFQEMGWKGISFYQQRARCSRQWLKGGTRKRRPGNQPTGAHPLVPSLEKAALITEQDLHTANLLHKRQGMGRTNRGREQNNNTIIIKRMTKITQKMQS